MDAWRDHFRGDDDQPHRGRHCWSQHSYFAEKDEHRPRSCLGGMALTTVTDVIGLSVFLGLATLLLAS